MTLKIAYEYSDLIQAFREYATMKRDGAPVNWIAVDDAWKDYCRIRDGMGYIPRPPAGMSLKPLKLKRRNE